MLNPNWQDSCRKVALDEVVAYFMSLLWKRKDKNSKMMDADIS